MSDVKGGVVCVQLFDCCVMDEGGVDACFIEDGGGCLAGEYARFVGAALQSLPWVSWEGLGVWIERVECEDELYHALTHVGVTSNV